jgi:hypothetical protein
MTSSSSSIAAPTVLTPGPLATTDAYTCASQKTTTVTTVATRIELMAAPWAELAAITAAAVIVP